MKSKIRTIMNGIDTELVGKVTPLRLAPRDHFVFLHCGQFYGPRSPLVLFAALKRCLSESPREPIKLAFVGPPKYMGRPLAELAAEAGVADAVVVLGEKSHSQALELSAGADALVLVGAGGARAELQVPQKIFEYLALRRPILALVSPENPAASILRNAAADAWICNTDDVDSVRGAFKAISDPRRVVPANAWGGAAQYDRCLRVEELLTLFEDVVGAKEASQVASELRTVVGSAQREGSGPLLASQGLGRIGC